MAKQNKTTLKNYFQTGDVPSQAQYADLIDSQLNLVETGTQTVEGNTTFEGNLSSSNIISSNHITASGNISASGNVIANTVNTGQGNNELYAMNQDVQTTDSVTFASITSSGDISASGTIFADNFQSTGGDVAGISFTDDLNLTGDLTASGTISANIISASGGVDATGFTINGIAVGTSTDTFWETGSSGKISYNAGNVGIGTLDPGEKLEVVGNISASGTGSFGYVVSNESNITFADFSNLGSTTKFLRPTFVQTPGAVVGAYPLESTSPDHFILTVNTTNEITGVNNKVDSLSLGSTGTSRAAAIVLNTQNNTFPNYIKGHNSDLYIYSSTHDVILSSSLGGIQLQAPVTASGNISSSGTITALSMSGDGSNITGIVASSATTASTVTVDLNDSIDLGVIPLISNTAVSQSALISPQIKMFYDQESTTFGTSTAKLRIGQSNPQDRPGVIELHGGPSSKGYITTFNANLQISPADNKDLILSASGTGDITLNGNVTQSGGTVKIDYDSLPTSNPNNKGQIYRDGSNALFVSAG